VKKRFLTEEKVWSLHHHSEEPKGIRKNEEREKRKKELRAIPLRRI